MKNFTIRGAAAFALCGLAGLAQAGPVAVDGSLGTEWDGITAVSIGYDAGAAIGNFGSPGTKNHVVGYDVFLRSDADYVYVALRANGDTTGQNFANLYFNTNLVGGSDWGLEVTNNRAFVPGGDGTYFAMTGFLSFAESLGNTDHVIELAIRWDYFSTDPSNIIPNDTNVANGIQLRSIQAFGYSVTGGDLTGGTRFGTVAQVSAVPEPGSWALGLAALGLAGLATRQARPRSLRRSATSPAR